MTETDLEKGARSFFYSFHRCKSDDVSFIKRLMTWKTFRYTAVIICTNKIITLATHFPTGTKDSAPNIIDFPSYRVILCSLSEQYYGAHRATNGRAATEIHLQRSANLLDKLIKLAINLGRPCAPVVYETVEASFIMRTMQFPLEKILSPFLQIYTSKDTRSFPSMH